jgi:hypothetical protein
VAEGRPDAEGDELHGAVHGQRQAVALHHAAGEHAGEGIAGAGVDGGEVVAVHAPEAALAAVVGHHGTVAPKALRHAGNDGDGRPHVGQAVEPLAEQAFVHALLFGLEGVGFPQQQGGFGEVGGDAGRLAHQGAHGFHHGHVHGGFHKAVVAQHGVDDGQAVVFEAGVDAVFHQAGLPARAQKAAVQAVEAQAEVFPVFEGGGGVVGEVGEVEIAEAGGCGREHGRRQGTDLYAQGGEYGDDHHQGGAAEAGQIMNGRQTRRDSTCHRILPLREARAGYSKAC